MLNFNNVPQDENALTQEFSIIPNGTVVRAVVLVQQGDIEIPEFGQGQWFKRSASTAAKWMNLSSLSLVVNMIVVSFGTASLLMVTK